MTDNKCFPEIEQVWTASKYTEGPNSDGYYTAGIDISNAFPDDRTHFSAIEFHAKDKATSEARRDLVLRGAAQKAPDLRELLLEASLQIDYLHKKFQPTGTGEATLARIRSALSSTNSGSDK